MVLAGWLVVKKKLNDSHHRKADESSETRLGFRFARVARLLTDLVAIGIVVEHSCVTYERNEHVHAFKYVLISVTYRVELGN